MGRALRWWVTLPGVRQLEWHVPVRSSIFHPIRTTDSMNPTIVRSALLLVGSNVFMTFAWYADLKNLCSRPLVVAIVASGGSRSSSTSFRRRPTGSGSPR